MHCYDYNNCLLSLGELEVKVTNSFELDPPPKNRQKVRNKLFRIFTAAHNSLITNRSIDTMKYTFIQTAKELQRNENSEKVKQVYQEMIEKVEKL